MKEIISAEEEFALSSAISGSSTSELAESGARKMLNNLAASADKLNLDPATVASAFASNTKTLSVNGTYYKLQAFLLSYTGTLITTVITAAGIAFVLNLLKRGAVSIIDGIRKLVTTFSAALAPGAKTAADVFGVFRNLFDTKAASDEVRDEAQTQVSVLAMAMASELPATAAYLVNGFDNLLSAPLSPVETAPVAKPSNSGLSLSSTNFAPATASAAPSQAAPTSTNWGNIGVSAAGQVVGALLNKGLGMIGLADEVRDEVRDDLQADLDKFGSYLAEKYDLRTDEVRDAASIGTGPNV